MPFKKVLLTAIINLARSYDLRIGMVAPVDNPSVNQVFGMGTSVGAIGLAIDRIQREQLLPGANISVYFQNAPCAEYQSVPAIRDMVTQNKIQVLLGPACPESGVVAGLLTGSDNIMMMSWTNSDPELEDLVRFPSLALVLPTAAKLGNILKAVADKFSWKSLSLFTNDDTGSRRCYYGKVGFLDMVAGTDIQVTTSYETSYKEEIPTAEFEAFWKLAAGTTRNRRRFMQFSNAKGYVTDEYVYVTTQFASDVYTSTPWIDYSSHPDGLDAETKIIYEKLLMVETQTEESTFAQFRSNVITRAKLPPINYPLKSTDVAGSIYSPYLHDATYLYALALNKTIGKGQRYDDGQAVFINMFNLSFTGAVENVSMDSIGSRRPVFTMKGFDKNLVWTLFAISTVSPSGVPLATLLVPESEIWALRGGKRPVDKPVCGYNGSACKDSTGMIAGLAGTFGGLLVVASIAGGVYRYIAYQIVRKNCRKIWRIEQFMLLDMKMASGMNSRTASTNFASSTATLGSVSSEKKLKNTELPPNCSLMSYKGELIWCKKWEIRGLVIHHKPDHLEFNLMRSFTHDNLNSFFGVCVDPPGQFVSGWKFCPKFSLQEIFNHEHIRLDWFFKYTIMKDVLEGLSFIHESPLKSYGNLKSSNVLMDGRWMIKLTDYGLTPLKRFGHKENNEDLLWTAPELLRMQHDRPPLGTPKGDIFSFAILIQEIVTESKPYECSLTSDEPPNYEKIIHNVRAGVDPPIRPEIDITTCGEVDTRIVAVAKECWSENVGWRPDVKSLKATLKKLQSEKSRSMMDHIMKAMEKYADNLENTVRERTQQLAEEKKRCDQLLYRLLPQEIAEKLKSGQQFEPESFDVASVFFSDVVGFTTLSSRSTPIQVVTMLNQLYTLFDDTIANHDVYKVETIGDAYLCVSGVPKKNGLKHVSEIADMALSLNTTIGSLQIAHLKEEKLRLRIGLCTGPVCAGVIGVTMPHYCIFGDTVTTAGKMESQGQPEKIQVPESTSVFLDQAGYISELRGDIMVKPKGTMRTYWLIGKNG